MLANELRLRSWTVIFAMLENDQGAARVREGGYRVRNAPATALADGAAEGEWLDLVVRTDQAAALILDTRSNLTAEHVNIIRYDGVFVATIDDPSDRRMAADAAFYPPVPQAASLNWTGFSGRLEIGWDWIVIRPEFVAARANRSGRGNAQPTVLVTMGGSDPKGLTLVALEALERVDAEFDTNVVLGPLFRHERELDAFLGNASKMYRIVRGVSDMSTVMAPADLAIASFGVTAYELAATGVPAIHLCLTEDHARSAGALSGIGAAINLGLYDQVSSGVLAATVSGLLGDEKRRETMSRQGTGRIDGLGARRITEIIDRRCSGN